MKLRMTKGVGIALAIAAGCAVMGFLMAPGWWFFAAFSAWCGFGLALGGVVVDATEERTMGLVDDNWESPGEDLINDPSYRHIGLSNIYRPKD